MNKNWRIWGMLTGILLISSGAWAQLSGDAGSLSTLIMVDAHIVGPNQNDGDSFLVEVTVTNVGTKTANQVNGTLFNTPAGWQVTPTPSESFGDIAPGESVMKVFSVTRDAEDHTIIALARGQNTNQGGSNRLKVPIHPAIGLALVATMVGAALWMPRGKPIA